MRNVLVTGAAGFLGSHLVDRMLAKGCAVTGFDNLSHGRLVNLENALAQPGFRFCQADVRDLPALRDAAREADTIVHLAAFKIPRYGGTMDTLLINSEGTLNALKVARECGARFLVTSTSDVYGKNPSLPFAEDGDSVLGSPTVARWAYAASKLFDEHMVLAAAAEWDVNASVVRIFGSYGPRQHPGWWGGPQSVFIDAILRDEVIPIHGDGLQTRSFTYVDDTVRGILLAAESEAIRGEIVNIGNNREITILALAELIHRLCDTGRPLRLEMVPYHRISGRPYEDVRRRVPSTEKAKRLLGFEARVALEQGLAACLAWQRRQGTAMTAAEGLPVLA